MTKVALNFADHFSTGLLKNSKMLKQWFGLTKSEDSIRLGMVANGFRQPGLTSGISGLTLDRSRLMQTIAADLNLGL